MGLGIHGEPGASKRKIANVDNIVAEVKPLTAALR